MTLISKEKRDEIKKAVLVALNATKHLSLPVNIKEVTKSYPYTKCVVVPYSKHMQKLRISYKTMLNWAGTDDSFVDFHTKINSAVIFYNDIAKNKTLSNRYRWNIAHELGHVALSHHIKYPSSRLFRGGMSDLEYREAENEAELFAAYILSPHAALYSLGVKNKFDIFSICEISNPASYRRFKDYTIWKKHSPMKDEYDKELSRLFEPVLDKKYKSVYFSCLTCDTLLTSENGERYCYICGNNKIQKTRKAETVKYKEYETNNNGQVLECLICSNEDFPIDADFCHICGKAVKNTCLQNGGCNSECEKGNELPSNARFCSYCGSKTMFSRNNLLPPWDNKESEAVDIIEIDDDNTLSF